MWFLDPNLNLLLFNIKNIVAARDQSSPKLRYKSDRGNLTEPLEVWIRVPPEIVWANIIHWGFQNFGLTNLNDGHKVYRITDVQYFCSICHIGL